MRSQPQSWLWYGPDLGVWVGQLPWKISLYCMYIDMSWKFCVIIQLYLSVPEELNSTSPPCFFSLVPAFSCDLLCYPEWRKEQNPPYFSLVNALHEGEITEMLWLKKIKKPRVCIFVLFLHQWGIGSFEVWGTLGKEKPRGKRVLEKQTWPGN